MDVQKNNYGVQFLPEIERKKQSKTNLLKQMFTIFSHLATINVHT